MYYLKSGDKDNTAAMAMSQNYPERAQEIRDEKTFQRVQYMIFKGKMNQKNYNTAAVVLSLGDELANEKRRVTLEDAKVLWFALNANVFEDANIGSMDEARFAWDLSKQSTIDKLISEGTDPADAKKQVQLDGADYRCIVKRNMKRNPKCDIKMEADWLFPGTEMEAAVFVSFFSAQGESWCCLAAMPYMELVIWGEKYQVPRSVFMPLFDEVKRKNRGRVAFKGENKTDLIREAMDVQGNKQAVVQMLEYCGFLPKQNYINVDISYGEAYLEGTWVTLNARGNDIFDLEEDERWTQKGDTPKFQLAYKQTYVAILNNRKDHVGLLMA